MSIIIPSHPSDEWRTPPVLFQKLDEEFDFDLDAAATAENALCEHYLTQAEDALSEHWWEVGWPGHRVWLNPPYGRALKFWVNAASHQAFVHKKLVVLLLPAHTSEKWFHKHIYNDDSLLGAAVSWQPYDGVQVRFLRGRLKFSLPGVKSTGARFGSMIVIMDGR